MQPPAEADPTVVSISTPADILGVLPHRLGFTPRESLVVVCLDGPRRRDRLVMRADLGDPAHDRSLAAELADRAVRAGATAAILVCYTEGGADSGRLARAALVTELTERLGEQDTEVVEALLVREGRWWSYRCSDQACCPRDGTPLSERLTPAAGRYAAESVARGDVVLGDRQDLVGSIEPPDDAVARQVRDQAADAAAERLGEVAGERGPDGVRALTMATLRRLADHWVEGRCEVDPGEAALVALGLHDIPARDEAMTLLLDREPGALVGLFSRLARLTDDVDAAPLCTVLAWTAYADGNGALAAVAAERALRAQPGYSMALLVLDGLDQMVPPAAIRDVSAQVRADLRDE